MKIVHTVAALSAVAVLIAGPTAFAEQHEGAGGMQSGGAQSSGGQQGQGAPSAGGAESGTMGGSAAGGGAQAMSSDQIRQVQQALKDKGHEVGSIDGKWGPKTQNALKEYQQAQGMSASGELDSQTLSSLGVSGSAVGAPGSGEQQPSPEAGGAPGSGGASEDTSPGAGTPTPEAGGAPGGGGASPDAGPGAATGGSGGSQ